MQHSVLNNAGLEGFFSRVAKARKCLARLDQLSEDLCSESSRLSVDLEALRGQLDAPFSLLVCGEFNAGKSSLINALAGALVTPVGPLPTTGSISKYEIDGLVLIDSPGLNSIENGSLEELEKLARTVDTAMFVISVERPLSSSERRFITELIERWKRRVIVVIHKIDLCSVREVEAIRTYIVEALPPSALLSVCLTSTRFPETISALRKDLQQTFSERIRQEAKLNAFVESAVTLADDAVSILERRRFQLECKARDLGAHADLLVDRRRSALARISPGLREGELFERLAVGLRNTIRNHWHLGSVVFSSVWLGSSLDEVCYETLEEFEQELNSSYLSELPRVVAEQEDSFQMSITELFPEVGSKCQVGASESAPVLGDPFESLRKELSALTVSAQTYMGLSLLPAVVLPSLLSVWPQFAVLILSLEAVALSLPLVASAVVRNWFLGEAVFLIQHSYSDFVRNVQDYSTQQLQRTFGVGRHEAEQRSRSIGAELQGIGAQLAAIREVRTELCECMFFEATPMFKVVSGKLQHPATLG
jgi:small GTP-binding protein